MATWVFGYGSLVSPDSLGATLRRPVDVHGGVAAGWSVAEVVGWGRRWNYGVGHVVGWWRDDDGVEHERVIVALGVAAASDERVAGVVVRVSDDELAWLDERERHYDRVDVTASTIVGAVTASTIVGAVTASTIVGAVTASTIVGEELDGPVVTYVPRPEAVARYEAARDAGRAAIEQRYWDLVDGAFAELGEEHRRRYHATTPAPDVPVLPMRREVRPR